MNKRVAIGIFLISLVVRLIYGWQGLISPEAALSNDGRGYVELAANLAHGSFPSLFRTPGYPLFLMMAGGFPGVNLAAPLLLQMILDSLTAVILASIAQRLWRNQAVSALAGLLYALSAVAATLSGIIMSEALGNFLIVAAFRLALSRPTWINTLGQAFCWVGATMTRPFNLLLPLIICAFVLMWFRWAGADWRRRLRSQAAILTIHAVCVLAWIGWNYHRSGMAVLCSNPDVTFYIYEIPAVRIIDQLSWRGYVKAALLQPKEFDRLGLEHQKAYAGELFPDMAPAPPGLWFTKDDPVNIRRIRADAALKVSGRWADLIGVHAIGALITLRPKWASANLPTRLLELLRILLIPIAVAVLIRKRQWLPLALFGAWTLYVALPTGACAHWRLRAPAEPVISLTLAFALTLIFSRAKLESKRGAEMKRG